MDYETKRPLMEQIDKCLLEHAVALGTKDGGPSIADVYGMQEMAELHYYLKVQHEFTPDEVTSLLQFTDPLAVAVECWEERDPAKGFPICDLLNEIKAYERFPLVDPAGHAQKEADQIQSLKDRIDQNMSDFQAELLGMDKAEIIAKSAEIAAMRGAHEFMKEYFRFEQGDAEILLGMENPLKFVATQWPSDIAELFDMNEQVGEAIVEAGKEAAAQQEVDVIQALNDLLDKNMSDFDAALGDMTAEEIAENDEIKSTREIYTMLRYDLKFERHEAELLLRMENPLKLLVDNFPCYDVVALATKALGEMTEETDRKALPQPSKTYKNTVSAEKPSILKQIKASRQESQQQPVPKEQTKGSEAR